ncbi:MAG: hypothetical protein ACRDI1_08875, partial [Actinomycetota bacterium]
LHRAVVGWTLENYLHIAPAEQPKMRMSAAELKDYEGKYLIEGSGQHFEVVVRNGALAVKFPAPPPPGPDGRKPVAPPATPVQFVAPDRVAATSGYLKGTGGEFLRGSRGKIMWFRLGGRIHRRVDNAPGGRS